MEEYLKSNKIKYICEKYENIVNFERLKDFFVYFLLKLHFFRYSGLCSWFM